MASRVGPTRLLNSSTTRSSTLDRIPIDGLVEGGADRDRQTANRTGPDRGGVGRGGPPERDQATSACGHFVISLDIEANREAFSGRHVDFRLSRHVLPSVRLRMPRGGGGGDSLVRFWCPGCLSEGGVGKFGQSSRPRLWITAHRFPCSAISANISTG
jgi:hypothetical protein